MNFTTMWRTAALAALLGGATLTACAPVAQTQTAPATSQALPPLTATAAVAKAYVDEDKVPGAVILVGREGAPQVIAAGRLAVEPESAPVDADTLWRVYSMTKPVTAMAAMLLIEDGKLKLDQPIADFIPEFRNMKVLTDPENSLASRPAEHQITVRHLLTHTGGLGYNIITKGPLLDEYNKQGINPAQVSEAFEAQARPVRPDSLEAFAKRVAGLPLVFEPGTEWRYSIGLDVLARVVEVAAKMPFETFVQRRLLDPLGMTSTFWTVPRAEATRMATSYGYFGEARVPLDPGATTLWLTKPSFPYGGAGLAMSARDYDRFLHMLLNLGTLDGKRVMKASTAKLAMSNLLPEGVVYEGTPGTTMGFGAGGSVYLESVPGGPGKGTFGWGGAFGTIAWVDPEHRLRVTGMVNYFPLDKWPFRKDVTAAVYADLAQ